MTGTSLAVVSRFGTALNQNRLDEACALLHEELVVHEAGGLPYSGDYHGPRGFVDLLTAMTEKLELTPGPINRAPLGDDTVVSRFRLRFTARVSGRFTEMNLVEIYTVSDGLIIALDVYYKDPSAVTALLAM
ncbi:nuclear transport factor 2 family protein [Mycobacterium manitobense]|uniref:Nuclear transport factor 2 family protein n=1 Tax=[Mycobacterium] manitobense TaxID=190147 RepID=A0A9X3BWC0_9MYCO|nr:nuclear transport factor 2 family protein [[Mycobacterium] manitobense]MCV7171526.1 nuclear transport factor 2 family protein [[Mycobacterium] manitobense]